MKIPADALRSIIAARGLDVATLATRAGVLRSTLIDALEDDGDLDDEDIASIATELAVPIEALFATQQLPLFPAVDFRSKTPSLTKLEKGTLSAISFVERISSTLTALDLDFALDSSLTPIKSKYTDDEAIALAKKWRQAWGITLQEQLEWRDANKVYTSLRSFIESLGIIVIHRTFRSDESAGLYIQVDDGPHTIVINTTKSSKARKLFTLAHEFCHVLLRQEGSSNPSIVKNRVEQFCNKFAAYLLAPTNLIREGLEIFGYRPSSDSDFVRLFAKKLGISQEALVIRLVEENFLTRSEYTQWRSRFNGVTPPGDTTDGQGGGATDPIQTKRTSYGSTLLSLLGSAKRNGLLDEIDIFRISGIKPKYQSQLFEAT